MIFTLLKCIKYSLDFIVSVKMFRNYSNFSEVRLSGYVLFITDFTQWMTHVCL